MYQDEAIERIREAAYKEGFEAGLKAKRKKKGEISSSPARPVRKRACP